MQKYLFLLILFTPSLYAYSLTEKLGHLLGIYKTSTDKVYFTMNPIDKNRFWLDASSKKYIPIDEMIEQYKGMAGKLCHGKKPSYAWDFSQAVRETSYFSTQPYLIISPRIVNQVNCQGT